MRAVAGRVRQRPSFGWRLARVVWVLMVTLSALVGGILWQAPGPCPAPCRLDARPLLDARPVRDQRPGKADAAATRQRS
jgi:hypothetical protein